MRQRAAESDVVIVNHHLLCADAAVRESAYGEVIPSCPHLVVDEAHQLEDVATQYFGVTVSNHRVDDLVRDAEAHGARLRSRPRRPRRRPRVDAGARPLARLLQRPGAGPGRALRRRGPGAADTGMVRRSPRHRAGAGRRARRPRGDLRAGRGGAPRRRWPARRRPPRTPRRSRGGPATWPASCASSSPPTTPPTCISSRCKGRTVRLRAAPIDVSRIVRDLVTGERRAAVLTSATLTVDGSFDYVRARLGLDDAAGVRVPSEFDYAHADAALPAAPDAAAAGTSATPRRWPGKPGSCCAARAGGRSCCSPATRRCARWCGCSSSNSSTRCWCRARRRARCCSRSSGARRTRCSSPRRRSGRAWTCRASS